MTASRGIRKSTKWKTVAKQQSQHALEALRAADELKAIALQYQQQAMLYRRVAQVGVLVSLGAIYVAIFL